MIYPDKIDIQIKEMDNENLLAIAKSIHKQGVAVFYNQKLNEREYIDTMKKFGECESPDLFMNPKEYPEIFLVTGKKVDGKKIGMFGDTELGWHSNGNSRHLIDKILIGLYCVKEDINTTLSVCNTQLPFEDMSDEKNVGEKIISIGEYDEVLGWLTANEVAKIIEIVSGYQGQTMTGMTGEKYIKDTFKKYSIKW